MSFLKRNISKLSDEELLQFYYSSGDSYYFGELYNRYLPLVYGVCLKYLQETEKAQDAAMQLFEDLLPKITKYEIAVFRTWLYSVVRNHCLQIIRKEKREISIDFNANIMESDEVLHLLNEEMVDDDKMEALKLCMEKLPTEQRISVTHFFMDEMSYADIGEVTGFSLSRIKSYIQNAKRNLKICIGNRLK